MLMCVLFLLTIPVQIVGASSREPQNVAQKVKILERWINTESNLRSYETALLFHRFDELEGSVNQSLEIHEKQCLSEPGDDSDKSGPGDVITDLDEALNEANAVKEMKHVIRVLNLAFRNQKLHIIEMDRAMQDIKNENSKMDIELERLKRVDTDFENRTQTLSESVMKIQAENEKGSEEITSLHGVFEQLKFTNSELEQRIESLIHNNQKTEDDIREQITHLKQMNASLHTQLDLTTQEMEKLKDKIEPRSKISESAKTNRPVLTSCDEAMKMGFTHSGIFNLMINSASKPLEVYCDQETDGGGWIVFQRRKDGSVDFFRTWNEYKRGFGNLNWEFWLGNDYLRALTAEGVHELRIDMEDFENNKVFAHYNSFKINDEDQKYKLEVSGYDGNATDNLKYHNGRMFSTKDNDNDKASSTNCAYDYTGAWWHNACHDSNLNGKYYQSVTCPGGRGIVWFHWKKAIEVCLKFTEMKLR